MEECPCGSGVALSECCKPVIQGEKSAETAEALLRSRYAAFNTLDIDHLVKTVHPDKQEEADPRSIERWARKTEWIGLSILNVQNGGPDDDEGEIEFIADYYEKGLRKKHHEVAHFKKKDGEWYFYEAETPTQEQYIRETPKVGRNDPCPCGSGKKYKKCCGR